MVPFLRVVLLIFITPPLFAAEYDDGFSAGASAGRSIMSEINEGREINNRFQVPLTSDTGTLSTFQSTHSDPDDPGPRSFNVRLASASSAAFLEITAQAGPTGDITSLIIRHDTDFNNTFDASYSSPMIASGVCANGIVSCRPGTWRRCRFYKWHVNPAGSIYLAEVPDITQLAGCYCLNADCGSNPALYPMPHILKDLGGGIVGILQEKSPNILITKVFTDENSIKYFGRRLSDADFRNGNEQMSFSGPHNPQQLYNPQNGTLPAAQEALFQQQDSTSPYNRITRSYDARLNPQEERSCSISNVVSIQPTGDLSHSKQDTCAALDLASCFLYREELCDYQNQNCVNSVLDGNFTGLTPISAQISIIDKDADISYQVTSTGMAITSEINGVNHSLASGPDLWWNIHRTYLCDTALTLDTDDGIAVSNEVSGSASKSGETILYAEYDPTTGTTISKNANLPKISAYGSCETACKVQRNAINTQAGAEANTWEYQNSVAGIQIIYKSCGLENTCPVEPGETVVQDCACLDEFANAASYMQVMENAANDMICNRRRLSLWEILKLIFEFFQR